MGERGAGTNEAYVRAEGGRRVTVVGGGGVGECC